MWLRFARRDDGVDKLKMTILSGDVHVEIRAMGAVVGGRRRWVVGREELWTAGG